MPEWICPGCEGGFPKPVEAHGVWNCPWCGKTLAKMLRSSNFDPIDQIMSDTDE